MKNDTVVLLGSLFVAIGLITWKGVENESMLVSLVSQSIIETAASDTTIEPSQDQLLDMNILRGYSYVSRATPRSFAMLDDQIISATEAFGSDEDAADRTDISEYEIQEGDTLGGIAVDFGVSIKTIISSNNIANENAIKPGSKLRIPPVDGLIYKVKKGDTVATLAKKFQADSSKIISYNYLPQTGDLQSGMEVIIPGGIAPKNVIVAQHKDTSSRRFALLPRLDKEFTAPANCIITQPVHGLNGIDCANKTGTSVYAAASGIVTVVKSSGNNNGYGRYVRITHPNGTATLYGHLSRIFVTTGQSVTQGEQIADMGNTGRSTGPHLHFEVRGAHNFLANYGIRGRVIAGQ